MKNCIFYFGALISAPLIFAYSFANAQTNYNAGPNSGTGGSGSQNVFIGPYVGQANTTGTSNSFLGYKAGYSNTTGRGNSFVGASAGTLNTTGSSNSFLGCFAGQSNTKGNNNSFLGYAAGYNDTTGNNNSFVGYQSGYFNTTGSDNSFIGYRSGYSNTRGYNNSFLGGNAGYTNTGGTDNSFVGYNAGYSNTVGFGNSFLGSNAGKANTTGGYNSFLGAESGYSNTTGFSNDFLGHLAGYKNTTGAHNSFLGAGSGYSNTTGYNNSFVGNGAGQSNTTGIGNSFVGTGAGGSNTTGSNNVFLGSGTNTSTGGLSNAAAIGARAYVSAPNSLVLGAIKGVNGATDSTKVGIGTSAPAYLLHVNGTAAKPGGGSWTVASDQRLKKNVSAFTDGLDVLTKVKPVWFEYNGQASMPTDKRYVGVIAQQMKEIAPYMVGRFTYQDTTGKKTDYLDYDANALTYILVNAIQEQQKQMEQLKKEKDALKQENETQEARLARLEQLLGQQLGTASDRTVPQSADAAQLWQNVPNPTNGTTVIRYRIPQQARQAQISLYALKGDLLQSFPLTQRGEGQLSLDITNLPQGVYLYRLLIDGKPVDAKKLLLN
jgi:hypothetical protein